MNKINRIVLSAAAAALLFTGAAAAQGRVPAAETRSLIQCIQNPGSCRSRLWGLIRDWFAGNSSKPEQTPTPDPTPDVTPDPEPDTPTVKPEGGSDATDSAIHAYEKKVAELVNRERTSRGLPALTLDETLCRGARMKSEDMQKNNYFSHTSPTYGSAFDMMRSLGITYNSAGENIAMGQTSPEAVVAAWMNSQSHRDNILSTKYTLLGVGYVANGNYWTQWFVG